MGFGEKFGKWAGIIGAAGTIGGAAEAKEIPQPPPDKETTIIVDSSVTEQKPMQDIFEDGSKKECDGDVCSIELKKETPLEEAKLFLEHMKRGSKEDYFGVTGSWYMFFNNEENQEAFKTNKELQKIIAEISQLILTSKHLQEDIKINPGIDQEFIEIDQLIQKLIKES